MHLYLAQDQICLPDHYIRQTVWRSFVFRQLRRAVFILFTWATKVCKANLGLNPNNSLLQSCLHSQREFSGMFQIFCCCCSICLPLFDGLSANNVLQALIPMHLEVCVSTCTEYLQVAVLLWIRLQGTRGVLCQWNEKHDVSIVKINHRDFSELSLSKQGLSALPGSVFQVSFTMGIGTGPAAVIGWTFPAMCYESLSCQLVLRTTSSGEACALVGGKYLFFCYRNGDIWSGCECSLL